MELPLIEIGSNAEQSVSVADETFARDFNEPLVHQLVVAYLAGGRAGTRAQKTRSEVRGGGAKPWRQKGTGRARAGTIRSPIWRGGGVTFAAKPQSHACKINRRMYRAGMRSILSELARQGRMLIVSELSVSEPKTKLMMARLSDLKLERAKVLLVDETLQDNVILGSRNLAHVSVCDVKSLNPVALVSADKVVMSKAALERIGEWLQ